MRVFFYDVYNMRTCSKISFQALKQFMKNTELVTGLENESNILEHCYKPSFSTYFLFRFIFSSILLFLLPLSLLQFLTIILIDILIDRL